MIITIKNLRVPTTIGVYEHEQKGPRELVLQVNLTYDHRKAAESDRLSDALDYESIVYRITQHVQHKRYNLLERFAAEVADEIMRDVRILELVLSVEKPGALPSADSVMITEHRSR